MMLSVLVRDRRLNAVAGAVGCVLLADMIMLALSHPIPVLGGMFAFAAALAVLLYPIPALLLVLFLVPFHTAIVLALNSRAHLTTGYLDYWKDAVIVALFLRAIAARLYSKREWPLGRNFGDNFLIAYVMIYAIIALASPSGPAVIRALTRDVEGPILFLSIVLLKPSRKQLWGCVVALLAAASVMGGAALYERLGPHQGFLTWYGAVPPRAGSSFFVGSHGYRAGSFLDSPLVLAFYLAGALPFAFAVSTLRSKWRIWATLAVVAVGTGLLVTITRSGYIGGGIGLILAIGLGVRNRPVRVALIGIVIVAGGATTLYFVDQGSQTFLRSGGNTPHRVALQRDLALIERRPLGYGLGTTDALGTRFAGANTPGATESTILAKTLEGGILALVLYALAIYVTIMRLRGARLRALNADDVGAAALAAGAIGAMVGVVLAGLFLGVQELAVETVLWGAPGIAIASAGRLNGSRSAPV